MHGFRSKYSNFSAEGINEEAFNYIKKGDLILAEKLLKLNTSLNPSNKTFNNLGVFYLTEGKFSRIKQTFIHNDETAKKMLLLAIKNKINFYSLSALAETSLNQNKFKDAEKIFLQAMEILVTPQLLNNLGVSLYYQKEYFQASNYFKKALESSNNENKGKIYCAYAYSLANGGETNLAREAFQGLIDNYKEDDQVSLIELIGLAYLCKDYKYVINNCWSALEDFFIDVDDYKIIIHSFYLLRLNEEAELFRDKVCEQNLSYDFMTDEEAKKYNESYYEVIKNGKNTYYPNYVPNQLFQCNYFGCKIHNNPF